MVRPAPRRGSDGRPSSRATGRPSANTIPNATSNSSSTNGAPGTSPARRYVRHISSVSRTRSAMPCSPGSRWTRSIATPTKSAWPPIAQLVNCLQSLFLADGDNFIVTPTYHVFAMHAAHQGADSLRTLVSAPRVPVMRNGKSNHLLGVERRRLGQGPAARRDDGQSVGDRCARNGDCTPRGNREIGSRDTPHGGEMNAHNTFESPDAVTVFSRRA